VSVAEQIQGLNLSRAETLEAMEVLWGELCRDGDEPKSPSWHESVLKTREAVASGEEKFHDWEEAKERVRSRHRERSVDDN